MNLIRARIHGSDSYVTFNPQHVAAYYAADDGSSTEVAFAGETATCVIQGDLVTYFEQTPQLGVRIVSVD